ncbi:DMT family transporter [Dickeya dadantii]|uniref:EamA family transporter n=1 Tax=Dickeya dadantii TaxID=204038 RepID=UPI00191C6AC9
MLLIVRRLPSGKWWWRSAVLGSLSMGLFFLLLYIAAQRLPSSIAASIGALSPLVFAGVAWLLMGERVNARFLGGAALGIIGILLIVGAKGGGNRCCRGSCFIWGDYSNGDWCRTRQTMG